MPKSWVDVDKFCKSVIEDVFNIANKNVAIEFKWSIQNIVLNIESKFKQYATKYCKLNLEVQVTYGSIIILPSYANVIDQKLLLHNIQKKKKINKGFKKLQKIDIHDDYLVH
eukprot:234854_1